MSNSYRYRKGATRPVICAYKTGVAFNIGDNLFVDSSDSYTAKPASSYTWQSAVATPSAPTVSNGGTAMGTGLTNAATGVKVSYNFPWGEGALSNAGSATPTANAAIVLAAVALPSPAVSRNIYVETSAGSGTYELWGVDFGGQTMITGYGSGQAPPGTPALSDATTVTQYKFVQSFLGVSAQYYDGTNVTYGIKDGNLRADSSGEFDFVCASASFNVGDYLGPAKATGNNLDAQQVVKVTSKYLAIARVVVAGSSVTTVRGQVMGSQNVLPRP